MVPIPLRDERRDLALRDFRRERSDLALAVLLVLLGLALFLYLSRAVLPTL